MKKSKKSFLACILALSTITNAYACKDNDKLKNNSSKKPYTFLEENYKATQITNFNNDMKIKTSESTPELTIVDQILFDSGFMGTGGRLYFSNMYSVALYLSSMQEVVDNEDSAAMGRFGNFTIIADHNNQGFDIIKTLKPGDLTYIKKKYDIIEEYYCVEICLGINNVNDFILSDGRMVSQMDDYDLIMYTCNENWRNVTIVFFNKVESPQLTLTLK